MKNNPSFTDDPNIIKAPDSQRAKNLSSKLVKQSIDIIDAQFGHGYAKKNPGLLSTLIDTQSKIYLNLFN